MPGRQEDGVILLLKYWLSVGNRGTYVEPVPVVLGRRIRRLRSRAGLTQTELAQLVLSSKTAISEYEQGHQIPKPGFVQRLEQALDADGVLLELYDLLNIGIQESATVADAETGAMVLTDWEMRIIPGLLQTPGYMELALRAGMPATRLDREMTIRLGRQKILSSLATGWFIIDESVLHRVYGGQDVMRGQLSRLEAAAEMPGVYVQVMPYTSTNHPGPNGPLRVIEYRDKAAIWFTEGPRSGRMSDDREEVAQAMASLNVIRAAALPVDESVEFIRNLRETKYEQ